MPEEPASHDEARRESFTTAKPSTWQEYMIQVLESASQLFYLLEAADQQLTAELARDSYC